jgi:hypothetical protein
MYLNWVLWNNDDIWYCIDATCKITAVADKIGVGVHFNPFVTWNGKVLLTFWVCGVVCKSDSLFNFFQLTFQFMKAGMFFSCPWHHFLVDLLNQGYFF